MSFVATFKELEIIILSKRQIPYDIAYMWNLKHDTNEYIYETDTQTQRTDVVAKGGGDIGEGRTGSQGLPDTNQYIQAE